MSRRPPLVVIGASAGGPGALGEILQALPPDFPAPIVVVQHIDFAFASGLAAWLGQHSALPVQLAGDGDVPRPGEVLLAAGPEHVVLERGGMVRQTVRPRQSVHRPSIDVFFHSVAAHANGPAIGVLLTGMGRDGASGLLAMRHAGAFTIAQDKATSAVYGMPKAAAALGAARLVLPLNEIAACLVQTVAAFPHPKRSRAS